MKSLESWSSLVSSQSVFFQSLVFPVMVWSIVRHVLTIVEVPFEFVFEDAVAVEDLEVPDGLAFEDVKVPDGFVFEDVEVP